MEEDKKGIEVKNKELKKVWSQEANYISVSEDKTSTVISYNDGLMRMQDKEKECELV
jgi:hypothetical protein